MGGIMPQDSNNQLLSSLPKFGQRVTLKWGEAVEYTDLIEQYHQAAAARAEARAAAASRSMEQSRAGQAVAAAPTSNPDVSGGSGGGGGGSWWGLGWLTGGTSPNDGASTTTVEAGAGVVEAHTAADLALPKLQAPGTTSVPLALAPRSPYIPDPTTYHGRPRFHEPQLLIKPPDHDSLTADEQVEEELHRLKLYADISHRFQEALEVLEADVMEYRRTHPPVVPKDSVFK
jgi:hypothetical protein